MNGCGKTNFGRPYPYMRVELHRSKRLVDRQTRPPYMDYEDEMEFCLPDSSQGESLCSGPQGSLSIRSGMGYSLTQASCSSSGAASSDASSGSTGVYNYGGNKRKAPTHVKRYYEDGNDRYEYALLPDLLCRPRKYGSLEIIPLGQENWRVDSDHWNVTFQVRDTNKRRLEKYGHVRYVNTNCSEQVSIADKSSMEGPQTVKSQSESPDLEQMLALALATNGVDGLAGTLQTFDPSNQTSNRTPSQVSRSSSLSSVSHSIRSFFRRPLRRRSNSTATSGSSQRSAPSSVFSHGRQSDSTDASSLDDSIRSEITSHTPDGSTGQVVGQGDRRAAAKYERSIGSWVESVLKNGSGPVTSC